MPENKPITSRYYPSLSDLIDMDKVPGFISSFVGDNLSKFFYRNLKVSVTKNGSKASYSLELISKEKVEKELLGGIVFVLNGDSPANLSAFPINLSYEWPLLAELRNVTTQNFSLFSILQFMEYAARIFKIDDQGLLANTFNQFVEPSGGAQDKFDQFLVDVNSSVDYSGAGLSLTTKTFDELVDAIKANSTITHPVVQVVYNVYVKDGNANTEKDNFKQFFKVLVPQGIEERLKEVLIPNVKASLELSASIEIPRDWALPLNPDRSPKPESTDPLKAGTPRASFTFATSKLSFDSVREQPFGLEADLVLNPTDIEYVSLGKTGLIAGIKKLKIDTRDDRNIPEVEADGRGDSFKGIYIEECEIEFPPNWNLQPKTGQSSPPRIIGQNVIMGSEGGVSADVFVEGAYREYFVDGIVRETRGVRVDLGTKQIKVVPVNEDDEPQSEVSFGIPTEGNYYIRDKENNYYLIDPEGVVSSVAAPKGILNFKIGNKPDLEDNLQVSLDSFNLSLRQNKVTNASCTGTLIIPRKDKDSLVIRCTVDFNDGFLVKAYFPKEQAIVDNAFTTIKLGGLEIGRVNDATHFGFKGSMDLKPKYPFIEKFLPNHMSVKNFLYRSDDTLDYDVGLKWKSGTTLTVGSDQPTSLTIPIHKSNKKADGSKRLISIKALKVVAEKKNNGTDPYLSLAATFIESQLNLKTVEISLSGLGFESQVSFPEEGGNFGTAQVDVDFVPPTAGKIQINAEKITGGGAIYYNEQEGSFDGIINLALKLSKINIDLKGIVCLQTKMPDGEKGFSLLVILTAEFDPIKIGMGFTLNGVGGLLGLNRTSDTEVLRTGVRDGSIERILFPKDPVANAPQIISQVKTSFPVARDRFIIGPLIKLGWGEPKSIIIAKVGVFIEVPNPVNIKVLGVAHAAIPLEKKKSPLLINLAFLADLDFGKKQFSLDASIFDSELVGITLTGDIAMRLFWGDKKYFLFTVGGFHPAFEVPPINLPEIRRLALTIRDKDNFKLWAQVYTAVTSNTFQFGAELMLFAGGKKYSAKARFWLDVLFRFNPFHFIADIGAEAGIYKGSKSILSAYLALRLQGPKPYIASGKASFKVLGVKLSVSFNKTFGEEDNSAFEPKPIWTLIENALKEDNNWNSINSSNNQSLVTLVTPEPGVKRLNPLGGLSVSQKVAPAGFLMKKFGNAEPEDVNKFTINSLKLTTPGSNLTITTAPIKEEFAPAEFIPMTDDQKLASPSFVQKVAGAEAKEFSALDCIYSIEKTIDFELIVIDREVRTVVGLPGLLGQTNAENAFDRRFSTPANCGFAQQNNDGENKPDEVRFDETKYTLVNSDDFSAHGATQVWFDDSADAIQYMVDLVEANPNLRNTIQVVDDFEFSEF